MGVTGEPLVLALVGAPGAPRFAMASLYLGAFHGPPTSTPTGDPLPVGATTISIRGCSSERHAPVPMVTPVSLTYRLRILRLPGRPRWFYQPDLNGKNYALNSVDPEPIEIISTAHAMGRAFG
jgi:hypothetical protein